VKALFEALGGTGFEPAVDEAIVREGAANLFRGIEGVGGRLWLTNHRLVFRPHALNVQSHVEVIPLTDVVRTEEVKNLWMLPNGLKIHTSDGRSLRFVLWGRRAWREAIEAAKSTALSN
jgi:hypothetical protein